MFKRYELHNHTDQSDASISCRQLIEHMAADRVDCFAVTDHNTISGHRIIRALLEESRAPVQCVYGMEYTTYYGHIVCPVLTEYVPWDTIDRRHPEPLFEACRRAGGITGVAHPFSFGAPFARGCRFDMTIRDYSCVDYIEVINNPEPLRPVNEKGLRWWEDLTLKGERLAACAGMDLHALADMSMRYATYVRGEEGGDAVEELRAAVRRQMTWVSRGMLAVWAADGERVRFRLLDARKPGYVPASRYTLTLKGRCGVRAFDLSAGSLTLPLAELSDIEIPELYAGEPALENLDCVAPPIRRRP